MARHILYYDRLQLTRLIPAFSTVLPDYQQRVEAIFTDDKSDPLWAGSLPDVAGSAISSTVREETKFLNGTIIIDLAVMTREESGSLIAGGGGLSSNKPSLPVVKDRGFNTLIHELLHILQGWVWGKNWDDRYLEARQETFGKDMFNEIRMLIRGEQGYLGYRNRYEISAFDFGSNWVRNNRSHIKAGLYDNLLPISQIKSLLSAN